MTGTALASSHRPQNKKLTDALSEIKEQTKGFDGVAKNYTLVKGQEDEQEANQRAGATMKPSAEQLQRINTFTKKVVTADEVVAFKTYSCNDLPDRDDDQFVTECVKDFASLPAPFSPTGKSFLMDHNYRMDSAKGRIFGTGVEKLTGATYLTNEVYVPNTDKNQGYIEDLDFGVAWAVSVGVMLGAQNCSICKEPFYYWYCSEGHEKGLFYDVKSDERDKYGWPIPIDPNEKNAVKAVRQFSQPRDMYELSQVILGAQYNAQLSRGVQDALVKSAERIGIPLLGLSADEAKEISFRHEPKRVSDARLLGELKILDDGTFVWTESEMVYTFDPENPEEGISSLGRSTNNKEESDAERRALPGGLGSEDRSGVEDLGAGLEGDRIERSGEDPSEDGGDLEGGEPGPEGSLSDKDTDADPEDDDEEKPEDESEAKDADDDSSGDSDDDDSDDEETKEEESEDSDSDEEKSEEDKAVSKKVVMTHAQALKSAGMLPESVVTAVKEASGNGLDVLLDGFVKTVTDLRGEKTVLESKAANGEAFVKELKSEVLDWYVKARQTDDRKKISVESIEKLIELAGDNIDLLKSMAEEQKELAQARFPGSVRRSSFPSDPNVSEGDRKGSDESPESEEMDEATRRARRRHA